MTDLPQALFDDNSFLGREALADELVRRTDAGARLLTAWGPPGIGKSRLIRELARRTELSWLHCDLTRAASVDDALVTVARRLDQRVGDDAAARLGKILQGRGRLLLLLDNVEQIVGDFAPLLASWLENAPKLQVVLGSRLRVGLEAERALELAPLTLPATAMDVGASPASRLFVDRVAERLPSHAFDPAEHPALLRVSRALEGIPLAIELAAARFESLGLPGLLERLDEPVQLLSPTGTSAGRRGSMRSALTSSFDLLAAGDQRAFAWLSVFAETFAVPQASALLGGDALGPLERLRDAALLRVEVPGRFRMLETVRAFAGEQLDGRAERTAAEAQLDRGLLSLPLGPGLDTGQMSLLSQHREDLRGALERQIDEGPEELARPLLARWHALLKREGPLSHLLPLLERAQLRWPQDAELHVWRGGVLWLLLDVERAHDAVQTCLSLDPAPAVRQLAYGQLANTLAIQARYDESIDAADALIALAEERADAGGAVDGLHHKASMLALLNRTDEALRVFEQAAQACRRGVALNIEPILLGNYANLALQLGDLEKADALTQRAQAVGEARNLQRLNRMTLGTRAHVLHRMGRLEAALVSVMALFEAGWPGERIATESAVNRVHVALSKLRSLGLKPALERIDGGYRIAPGYRVEFDDGAPAEREQRVGLRVV